MTETLQFTPDQLADIRNRVKVSSIVGQRVKLDKAGREFKGLCPFHTEKTPSFTVNDEKGFYHCFGCGSHGDVIRWLTDYENIPFVEAVKQLAADSQITLTDAPATSREMLDSKKADKGPSVYVDSFEVAQWAWRTAGPALGEIPENWFDSRGIEPSLPLVQRALRRLKFHPRMPLYPWKTYEKPEQCNLTFPAMIAAIELVHGPFGSRKRRMTGIHVTYLASDGRGKASLPARNGNPVPARKIYGSVTGGAVWLSGVDGVDGPVESPAGRAPIVVGEGIESTLAAMIDEPGDNRGAAALSLNNLQGSQKKGPSGQLRMYDIEPSAPGFIFDDPGPAIIAIDADMKEIKVRTNQRGEATGPRVQERKGARIIVRAISGPERADICATLAVKNWRAANAHPVTAIRPHAGMDFNDQLMTAGGVS